MDSDLGSDTAGSEPWRSGVRVDPTLTPLTLRRPLTLTPLTLTPNWGRLLPSGAAGEADGEVGRAPELHVGAGAVAHRDDSSVAQLVAPQLAVESRRLDRARAPARSPRGARARTPRAPVVRSRRREPRCVDAEQEEVVPRVPTRRAGRGSGRARRRATPTAARTRRSPRRVPRRRSAVRRDTAARTVRTSRSTAARARRHRRARRPPCVAEEEPRRRVAVGDADRPALARRARARGSRASRGRRCVAASTRVPVTHAPPSGIAARRARDALAHLGRRSRTTKWRSRRASVSIAARSAAGSRT